MLIKLKRIHKRSKLFSRNEDGATAIEFAFVAIPFFALIFAIIELAIIFFINSALSNAVSEAGRVIRVGQFQNCGAEDRFKALVCENMSELGQCSQNLVVNVISEPSFNDVVVPDNRNVTIDPATGEPVLPADSFDQADASTPVVVSATLYYRLALPPQLTRLESIPNTGLRILKSTTAFRTEPFPASSTCGLS